MRDHNLLVIGSDYTERGEVSFFSPPEPDDRSALLGMTTGLLKAVNEDAGGWRRSAGRSIYAVADAHFGAQAAAIAVRISLGALSARLPAGGPFKFERFRAAFPLILEEIEAALALEPIEMQSESTLLVAVSGEDRLFWGSFGDSRLYSRSGSDARLVNPIRSDYLGRRARLAAVLAGFAETGELTFGPEPSCLLLATDGLAESRGVGADDWSPAIIAGHLSAEMPLQPALSMLFDAALMRGGTDNICAIGLKLPASAAGPVAIPAARPQ